MVELKNIKNQLSKTSCAKCQGSLSEANLVPITEMPLGMLAHVVCTHCKSENMLTITSVGTGVMQMISDLESKEVKKFIKAGKVSLDEVLDLHQSLKKESLWNLLHKKERNSAKKTKN